MKTLRPSTEPKRERERPTEDEERGWSTHVREAFPPRGTGGGAHHLLVAPSAPSFHPRFFRAMANVAPSTPTPLPDPNRYRIPRRRERRLPPGEEGSLEEEGEAARSTREPLRLRVLQADSKPNLCCVQFSSLPTSQQLNTADHRSGRSGKSDVGEVKKFQGKSVKDLGF